MRRSRPLPELLQIASIAAGYASAILIYRTFYPDNFAFLTSDEVGLGFAISVAAMWSAVKLLETGNQGGSWARIMDEFCVGTGLNLIVDALLNYFDVLTRSLFLIVTGSLAAVLLLAIVRRLMPQIHEGVSSGILLVGYDRLAHRLASELGEPLLGVLGASGASGGVPPLGDCSQFEAVVEKLRPSQIVVASGGAACVPPSKLLAQRLRGIAVSETSGLYEHLLGRIYFRGFAPGELVLSQALSTNSRTLAIQAVYTNLIAMALLLVLSPVMAAAWILVAMFCGPGPVIESGEYCGFQNIPFRLMRFRTWRRDGAPSSIGAAIARLRLDRLPQLFNIIRGEMALFGPRPVRRQFAKRLTERMPFYAMRFSVKPGLLGWAQLKLRGEPARACELTEFEYDLYYIKRASPLLDLDILAGTLFGGTSGKVSSQELVRTSP
jgi:lipopolysaccharide/colanic/teichoic acid biosynthesis glycosyltransferase